MEVGLLTLAFSFSLLLMVGCGEKKDPLPSPTHLPLWDPLQPGQSP